MEENASGTESEQTDESSQDEFESIEVEVTDGGDVGASHAAYEDDSFEPYTDEPLADEDWLANYRKEQEEKTELEENLTKRLDNRVRVGNW